MHYKGHRSAFGNLSTGGAGYNAFGGLSGTTHQHYLTFYEYFRMLRSLIHQAKGTVPVAVVGRISDIFGKMTAHYYSMNELTKTDSAKARLEEAEKLYRDFMERQER